MMDRHPSLRVAILESGFGWLPFWGTRPGTSRSSTWACAEDLQHKPSEYMTSGRFFASIVLHEGPQMMRTVTDLLGDGILMFGSDYPHAESRFPNSVDKVLAWREIVDEKAIDKLLWDNPVRLFGEP